MSEISLKRDIAKARYELTLRSIDLEDLLNKKQESDKILCIFNRRDVYMNDKLAISIELLQIQMKGERLEITQLEETLTKLIMKRQYESYSKS
jgi:hypothetical protein